MRGGFHFSQDGLKCYDWINDCNYWCHAYVSGNKYGDQKYLNGWIKKYNGVKVIASNGANLAPGILINLNYLLREKKFMLRMTY